MLGHIVLFHLCCVLIAAMKCSSESPSLVPNYYLIEKCHRSKLGVVARAHYKSLTSCQRLGIEKKALAFNFSPPEVMNFTKVPMEYTCEVLKCAEAKGGLSLTNDTRFDYYSIYANPIQYFSGSGFVEVRKISSCKFVTKTMETSSADINSTCVPATGMFHLLEKRLNYTQAQVECRNLSGVLAEVISEQRTDILAQFIAGAKLEAAYVGMRRYNTTKFVNTNGDSLDCSTFRAWAPGHPRKQYKQYDCAVITRYRTWRSISCKAKHAALCELIPAGPYKPGSVFSRKKMISAKPVNTTIL